MNDQSLRVLIVEDSEDDTLQLLRTLRKGGYNPLYERVETATAMKKALKEKQWDIILCEYSLTQFNAASAIAVLKKANIDIPLIVVTGAIGKETISEFMRLDVQGYIMKSNLSHLCPAIERELEESEIRVQRKRRDEALKESENKYRLLAHNINDVVFVMDMNLNYSYISPSVKLLSGYEPEEVLQQTPSETLAPSSMDLALRTLSEIMEMEKSEQRDINISRTLQLEMMRKDGTTVWVETKASFVRDENQRPVGIMGVTRDITERKQAEDMIRESEERYRTLFEDAQDGIALADAETSLLVDCNQALCRMVERDKPELLGQAQNILHPPEDLIDGLSPTFLKHQIDNPGLVLEDRLMARGGRLIPVEIRAAKIRINNRNFLLGMFRDITERKKAEEQIQQTLDSLRKAVGTTIQVLVSAIEMRDPYTAGHQLRVANLARDIATEIGLSHNIIEGIWMAGSIHDIGKISIPENILTKLTKLTNLEFSLIKEHSQRGYEMLKNVESPPWQLAEIVYQHHERMNGSGYPRSLRGDEILMESRILAVADVVEAMASHRPYRPTLGIEAALEEIMKKKGILYDHAVADACLKLFREKGYRLT